MFLHTSKALTGVILEGLAGFAWVRDGGNVSADGDNVSKMCRLMVTMCRQCVG